MRHPARWRLALLASLGIALHGCGAAGRARARAAPVPAAPQPDVDVTLFFIGDAGAPAAPADSEPVLRALRAALSVAPHPVVAFLGDNIYPRGMPDSGAADRPEAERRLSAQLRVLVKRILRKYGYPPDKQERATQLVLEQAEVLSEAWAA